FVHGGDALYRGFDHFGLVAKLNRRRRAGLGTGWYLIIDQTVIAQGTFIGGAFVFDVHCVAGIYPIRFGMNRPGIAAFNDTKWATGNTGSATVTDIVLDDHGPVFSTVQGTRWAHV